MKPERIPCYVVSHTHWDREWYLPFEKYRVRLVKMMDHLLNTLEKPGFKCFVFDGQMVPIEDYLEIRPEKEDCIRQHVQSGKLVIGPCYVLPDEYLISGESHVRNLIQGHAAASRFGPVQKEGYYPDPFGHVSQMPQILQGFGINTFYFMRGMGDEGKDLGLEFFWEGPEGLGRLLAFHQAGTYGNLRMLGIPWCEDELYPVSYRLALREAEKQADFLLQERNCGILLFNNGIDHLYAQESIPEVIDHVNRQSPRLNLIHSDFHAYAEAVRNKVGDNLKTWRGEIHSGRYNWILTGTLSARMYLKQANFECEGRLARLAEPLCSMAFLLSGQYPDHFLRYAWKTLLKNHPHDSICGCSIDEVHRDMLNRFDHVKQVSEILVKDAMDCILSAVKFRDPDYGVPVLVVNTRPHERSGEVCAEVVIPHKRFQAKALEIVDNRGNVCPGVFERLGKFREEKFWGRALQENVRLRFLAENVPAWGYRAYYIRPCSDSAQMADRVSSKENCISNEHLDIMIHQNGTLTIKDRNSGHELKNIHYFSDCADRGDEYDFSHIEHDLSSDTRHLKAVVKTEVVGGFKAVAHVSMKWHLPAALSRARKSRLAARLEIPISFDVTLRSGERRIEFNTVIENRVKDHRLRVVFPTDIHCDHVSAESKFDVIDRSHCQPDKPGWMQPPLNSNHNETFLSISNGDWGVTVLNKGLPEYETVPSTLGVDIHLTLLRCVGWLSRGDLLTRGDNAGPPLESPEGQCLGRHVFEYALILHPGDWEKSGVQSDAYDYITPLLAGSFYHKVRNWKGEARLPEVAGLAMLSPNSLVLTALKQAENRKTLILRLYNPTSRDVPACLDFAWDILESWLVRMDETRLAPLNVENNHLVSFRMKPKEIVTLEVVFPEITDSPDAGSL